MFSAQFFPTSCPCLFLPLSLSFPLPAPLFPPLSFFLFPFLMFLLSFPLHFLFLLTSPPLPPLLSPFSLSLSSPSSPSLPLPLFPSPFFPRRLLPLSSSAFLPFCFPSSFLPFPPPFPSFLLFSHFFLLPFTLPTLLFSVSPLFLFPSVGLDRLCSYIGMSWLITIIFWKLPYYASLMDKKAVATGKISAVRL